MRLNEFSKSVVMGNIQLLDYCNKNNLNVNSLKKCNIEKMGNEYFFVMSKKYKSLEEAGDIGSQPDVVLVMNVEDIENYQFDETECTERLLA